MATKMSKLGSELDPWLIGLPDPIQMEGYGSADPNPDRKENLWIRNTGKINAHRRLFKIVFQHSPIVFCSILKYFLLHSKDFFDQENSSVAQSLQIMIDIVLSPGQVWQLLRTGASLPHNLSSVLAGFSQNVFLTGPNYQVFYPSYCP